MDKFQRTDSQFHCKKNCYQLKGKLLMFSISNPFRKFVLSHRYKGVCVLTLNQ
jgi:hypothetical protein